MTKKVLITGATMGIGYALAERFAEKGFDLVLCARHEDALKQAKEELEKKYGVCVCVYAVDLCDHEQLMHFYENVRDQNIEVLVNNAGIGFAGEAVYQSIEKDDALVDLNIKAVMDLCKLFGRKMCERGHGTIINLSSTGAFQPGPYIASYYASKSFVLSYSRAMAVEMKPYGVHVCCVCPGPVDTAFYQKSGGRMSAYHTSAEHVADVIMHRYQKRTVVVIGSLNQFLCILPSGVKMKFLAKMKHPKTDHGRK
ncbi:MAG: SDR family oxidoreductase [Lactimicrobium sp.]|jgi:short-subunit dehydrogenase|uniref:SDR family NAD(P)-dependent oxidoreductase n=1 Tax=Lactimicrobium sp. TaxID=2563780 RepID=UPI002F35DEBF